MNGWKESFRDPLLAGILVFAFLVRFLAVPVIHRAGSTSDEREYTFIAKNLLAGDGFVDSNGTRSVRAPLYPSALAGSLLLDGGTLTIGYLLNVLSGTLAVGLVYLLTGAAGGNRSASRYAAGLAALFPGLIIYSTLLQTEALYLLFFLTAILLAILLSRAPTIGKGIAFGLVGGLAGLTRAVFVPFFPILLLASALGRVVKGMWNLSAFAIALLAFVLTMLPWGIRNYSLHGRVIPVSTFAGPSLLLGNNPYSHGTTRLAEGFDEWLDQKLEDRTGKRKEELSEVVWSETSEDIAFEYIREHPRKWASNLLRKAQVMLAYPITNSDSDVPLQMIAVGAEAFLLLAAVLGLLTPLTLERRRVQVGDTPGDAIYRLKAHASRTLALLAGVVAAFLLVHTLLHAEARYRLPLVPLLCAMAGIGLASPGTRTNRWSAWSVRRRLALALLWGALIVVYGVTGWMYVNGSIT